MLRYINAGVNNYSIVKFRRSRKWIYFKTFFIDLTEYFMGQFVQLVFSINAGRAEGTDGYEI